METRTIIRSRIFAFLPVVFQIFKDQNRQKYNFACRCICVRNLVSLTQRYELRLKVCHNRVMKKVFRPKSGELTGDCKMLHDEKLHDLHATINFILAISSRLTRSAGHVARMGRRQMQTGFS
jgi:hypothetical protein